MTEKQVDSVTITDATLREYGQNVKKEHLNIFTPEIRIETALQLVDAGFNDIEILSCVNPNISPAMNETDLIKISQTLGRIEGINLITLVPNTKGFNSFIRLDLGPDGYNHTMGFFFSAVEAHNRINLGRSINETIDEYKSIAQQAASKHIRIIGYLSTVFGYLDPKTNSLIKTGVDEINHYIDEFFNLGANTVSLSDTQGVANEHETQRELEAIIAKRNNPDTHRLGYHPHHISDDQALSNSLAAYAAGIRRFDASLGGTGGCVTGAPGNQPTEGLVARFVQLGIDTGIDSKKVAIISEYVKNRLYNKI